MVGVGGTAEGGPWVATAVGGCGLPNGRPELVGSGLPSKRSASGGGGEPLDPPSALASATAGVCKWHPWVPGGWSVFDTRVAPLKCRSLAEVVLAGSLSLVGTGSLSLVGLALMRLWSCGGLCGDTRHLLKRCYVQCVYSASPSPHWGELGYSRLISNTATIPQRR